jgi:hypothetical protein
MPPLQPSLLSVDCWSTHLSLDKYERRIQQFNDPRSLSVVISSSFLFLSKVTTIVMMVAASAAAGLVVVVVALVVGGQQ